MFHIFGLYALISSKQQCGNIINSEKATLAFKLSDSLEMQKQTELHFYAITSTDIMILKTGLYIYIFF